MCPNPCLQLPPCVSHFVFVPLQAYPTQCVIPFRVYLIQCPTPTASQFVYPTLHMPTPRVSNSVRAPLLYLTPFVSHPVHPTLCIPLRVCCLTPSVSHSVCFPHHVFPSQCESQSVCALVRVLSVPYVFHHVNLTSGVFHFYVFLYPTSLYSTPYPSPYSTLYIPHCLNPYASDFLFLKSLMCAQLPVCPPLRVAHQRCMIRIMQASQINNQCTSMYCVKGVIYCLVKVQ